MYSDYIFDFYGTLVDIRTDENSLSLWRSIAREYTKYNIISDPKALRKEYKRLVNAEIKKFSKNKKYEAEISIEKVFAGLFPGENIDPFGEFIITLVHRFRVLSTKYLYAYEGVDRMLEALKANGRRVFLLSNAQRIFTEEEIKKLDLEKFFDKIYLSSDYGVKKPDPLFFEILQKEQNINPKKAVMIGNDGICDIEGGKKAGLDTIYIKTATSPDNYKNNASFCLNEPDMDCLTNILLNQN